MMTGLRFPELDQLERIIEQLGDHARVEIVERIPYKNTEFPIYCIALGARQDGVPVQAFSAACTASKKLVPK